MLIHTTLEHLRELKPDGMPAASTSSVSCPRSTIWASKIDSEFWSIVNAYGAMTDSPSVC